MQLHTAKVALELQTGCIVNSSVETGQDLEMSCEQWHRIRGGQPEAGERKHLAYVDTLKLALIANAEPNM